jgi:hypothetical protein
MNAIKKKIVTDENMVPIAVQIGYEEWKEIERKIGMLSREGETNLARYAGSIRLAEDPLAFQLRVRAEWR